MLPVLHNNITGSITPTWYLDWSTFPPIVERYPPQHLHLISDAERNEDDWCISFSSIENNNTEQIEPYTDPVIRWRSKYAFHSDKKIEATTDVSLELPLIPKYFIDEFIRNEGDMSKFKIYLEIIPYLGKVLTRNNEDPEIHNICNVILVAVKDNFQRNEVGEIAKRWTNEVLKAEGQIFSKWFDKWFNDNY